LDRSDSPQTQLPLRFSRVIKRELDCIREETKRNDIAETETTKWKSHFQFHHLYKGEQHVEERSKPELLSLTRQEDERNETTKLKKPKSSLSSDFEKVENRKNNRRRKVCSQLGVRS
jgi:hypothetical protein